MNTKQLVQTVWRRRSWLFKNLSLRKIWNLGRASVEFGLQRETMSARPAFLKIDISPICNLRCTVCVHADPNGSDLLERQVFAPDHKMSVERFREIIDQVRDHTTAVSLYTWGDPMTHPDLAELCRVASDAGLQVHVSSNMSFKLSDEKVRKLADSGLTHLTACVDGLSQSKYERTRVGGRIEWVLSNIERVCQFRDERGGPFPMVEVQFIKYQHNVDELEEAQRLCESYGIDHFSSFWGALHNYADREPDTYTIHGPKKTGLLPGCFWPHYSMVVKWNGDVIPCCEHRMAAQHAVGGDARVFGNVFDSSVAEIWNSAAYRQARRLVSKPERSESEPELKNHFCDGCFVIFETDLKSHGRFADKHTWEEVFEPDGTPGHPKRRPAKETGLSY